MPTTYSKSAKMAFVLGMRPSANNLVTATFGDLNTVVGSGFSKKFPFWFTQVPNSVVLMTNGIDPMQRWNASTGLMEVAGVPSPTTSVIPIWNGTGSTINTNVYAFCRFYDNYGNVSDLSPVGVSTTPTTVFTSFQYTSCPLPTGNYALKVVGRQLLRNTVGQATTFYVDIDTTDLTSTSFTSYQDDSTLRNLIAVPLLDSSGNILANTHGFPPSWKVATQTYLGRVFAAAEVVYSDGNVSVTSYSNQVYGIGTAWPADFAGRHLFISNPPGEYEIESVDSVNQILTLTTSYNGQTDPFVIYGIRAPSSEWRLIYWTPSGQPESWPVTYALSLQDDGDEITGLMQLGSFLYILENQHIYRMTFLVDPAVDGAIFLSSRRGCLSQRLWVQAESTAYLFDRLGIHTFTGGTSVPISDPIQDLWRENSDSPYVINWSADTSLWSCAYNAQHTTIRFFVAMSGTRYPYHALCYNHRTNRWWIEEYPRPICSSYSMKIGQYSKTVIGIDCNNIVALDEGYIDGSRGIVTTTTGTVTATTSTSLTDSDAVFTSEVINMMCCISRGHAKGQMRRIVNVTNGGTRLVLKTPWNIKPRAGDVYLVGGINWFWQPGWFRLLDDASMTNSRDVELLYRPQTYGQCDLQLFYNRTDSPRVWQADRSGTATVTAGDSRVEIDMTDRSGRGIMRVEGHRERYIGGDIYLSPELEGFQHGESVRVYRMTIMGASQET